MTDQPNPNFVVTTNITDQNSAHDELEAHRKKAIEHFGGHVHIVKNTSSSVPMHDGNGDHSGFVTVMTSVWKAAPPEVAQEAAPVSE